MHRKYAEMDRNYTAVGKFLVILAVEELILIGTKNKERRRKEKQYVVFSN